MRTTMIYKHILIAINLAIISTSELAYKKIPMIDKKYNGKYFLISNKKKGGINLVIYKSVFSTETVYSKMEINCSTGKYRKIGEGINSESDITTYTDKGSWIEPIYGASHYDVVKFTCK